MSNDIHSDLALLPTAHVITVRGEPTRLWRGRSPHGVELAVFCSGIVAWRSEDGQRLIDELEALLGTIDAPRSRGRARTDAAAELDAYRRCIASLLRCRSPEGPPGPDDATLRALLVSTATADAARVVTSTSMLPTRRH